MNDPRPDSWFDPEEPEDPMTDRKEVPPRVGVERQHKDVLTGELKWQGLNPRANRIIDHVVAEEYLSLQEHDALAAESVRESRAKAFEEAAVLVKNGIICHDEHNLPARLRELAKAARSGEKAGGE